MTFAPPTMPISTPSPVSYTHLPQQGQSAPSHRQQHTEDVPQVVGNRAYDVREFVGLGAVFEKLLVLTVEALFGLFFVAENLDDLLAVDHLFDVAVDVAQRLLLLDEVFAALPRQDVYKRQSLWSTCSSNGWSTGWIF